MSDILDIIREEVVREIEARVPTPDARWMERGRCIQATHVGLNTLSYFGIEGKPLVTQLITGNRAWAAWMADGGELPMPDEAWAVGIDITPKDVGYPAHLVIRLDDHLLDLDAGFYARPQFGIHIPPTVYAPLTDSKEALELGNLCGVDLWDDGVLLYGIHPAPPNFYASNAWKHTETWAGPVIRRVRARVA